MSSHIYTITKYKEKIYSFLLQDAKAVEIHCDESAAESLLGNIYIGKIKNIAKNISAAFVEIAPGRVCHLPLEDIKYPVYTRKGTSKLPQAGDELLVQVSREGIKTKYPSVTTNITLHGKYVLLTAGNHQISVSSKLSREKKEELLAFVEREEALMSRDVLNNEKHNIHVDQIWQLQKKCSTEKEETLVIRETPNEKMQDQQTQKSLLRDKEEKPYGWLIRTNAGGISKEMLAKDMARLRQQYEYLVQQACHRTCFSCLHRTPASYLSRLSNLYDSEEIKILTDDTALYQEIETYLKNEQPEDLNKLTFYQDDLLPMHKLYSLEHQLEQALAERVWLNSGGYLVIQPTEALTVVDVNTGKFEGGKKKEAAFLKINLEAAKEIARQIRLRNLSGIILVDFINMKAPEANQELMQTLASYLRQDPVKTVLVDMTKLSLVEITRMKRERPLREAVRVGTIRERAEA